MTKETKKYIELTKDEKHCLVQSCFWMHRLGFIAYANHLESIAKKIFDWPPNDPKHWDPKSKSWKPGLHNTPIYPEGKEPWLDQSLMTDKHKKEKPND